MSVALTEVSRMLSEASDQRVSLQCKFNEWRRDNTAHDKDTLMKRLLVVETKIDTLRSVHAHIKFLES